MLCGVFFAVLAIAVKYVPEVSRLDSLLSRSLQTVRTPFADQIMVFFTLTGNALALIFIAVAILITLALARAWLSLFTSLSVFLSVALTVKVLKAAIGRARPIADLYPGVESLSFPSGHMTNASVILGALALIVCLPLKGRQKKIAICVFLFLIGMIGLSRVYLGAHWPTDIIGAALLASPFLLCLNFVYTRHLKKAPRHRLQTLTQTLAVLAVIIYGALHLVAGVEKYAPDKYNLEAVVPLAIQ